MTHNLLPVDMAHSRAKSSIEGIRRQAQCKTLYTYVTSSDRSVAARPRGIEKRLRRPLRRSARLADARDHSRPNYTDIEPSQLFPSPPISTAISQEVRRPSVVIHSRAHQVQAQQFLPSPPRPEAIKVSHPPLGSEANRSLERKRKRSPEYHDPASYTRDEPTEKRVRPSSPDCNTANEVAVGDSGCDENNPIKHWIETATWPKRLFETDFKMNQQKLTKKRSSSAMSYSQGVREGIYPSAHTSEYEQLILEPAGMILAQQRGETAIGDHARKLCNDLLEATYKIPSNSHFEGDLFWNIMESVRNEGEGRVVRDIQPNLVPSAEILSFRGLSEIHYLREKIVTPWNRVVSLAGPIPCPDFALGFSPSAFTSSEIEKLDHHHTPDTPSRFTGNLYFPFFTCEAKVSCFKSTLMFWGADF